MYAFAAEFNLKSVISVSVFRIRDNWSRHHNEVIIDGS